MSLADLAYEGEPETSRVPVKTPKGGQCCARIAPLVLILARRPQLPDRVLRKATEPGGQSTPGRELPPL
jgi:hypothetical protein